jgi:hypothetical protein
MISYCEITSFANNVRNKVRLGQCTRSAYKFYKLYANTGVSIYHGLADYYVNGEFVKTVDHCWNAISADRKPVQVIDVYNYKANTGDEYRNHSGVEWDIYLFEEFYKTSLRLRRRKIRLG